MGKGSRDLVMMMRLQQGTRKLEGRNLWSGLVIVKAEDNFGKGLVTMVR